MLFFGQVFWISNTQKVSIAIKEKISFDIKTQYFLELFIIISYHFQIQNVHLDIKHALYIVIGENRLSILRIEPESAQRATEILLLDVLDSHLGHGREQQTAQASQAGQLGQQARFAQCHAGSLWIQANTSGDQKPRAWICRIVVNTCVID